MNIKKLEITPEMLSIISELDQFKGNWQLLGHLSPEYLRQLKKVATIESVGSSTRIEGAKLSDTQVEALLSRLQTYSFHSRDEQEVAGYGMVCEEIFASYQSISLTENYIKQLHAMLLSYSDKDERHRGEYKKLSNHVEAFDETGKSLGVIFSTTAPFQTPMKMEELIYWTRQELENKELHPLLITSIFIVVFLAIHPFQDGNGRLSRILTTLLLLKSGYSYVPYSSLESVIEDNKEGYYLALRRTQKTLDNEYPDWTPWIIFFLRVLQKQKIRLEAKLEPAKRNELVKLSQLSAKIVELTKINGHITIAQIVVETQANRNTIKKSIERLVNEEYLMKQGKGRATWYTLK